MAEEYKEAAFTSKKKRENGERREADNIAGTKDHKQLHAMLNNLIFIIEAVKKH